MANRDDIWCSSSLKSFQDNGFKFHCGKIYTEDDFLVFTIFVRLISKYSYFKKRNMETYFEKFGAIISIIKVPNKGPNRRALIQFDNAENAAKALRKQYHQIQKILMEVRPAYSWHQPIQTICGNDDFNYYDCRNRLEEAAQIRDCQTKSKIFDLNDDCLLLVNSYLTFSEQFKLSKVCKRFETVFEVIFRIKHKVLEIDYGLLESFTLLDWRKLLMQCGHHVISITYCSNDFARPNFREHQFMQFVSQYCIGLKVLRISYIRLSLSVYRKLAKLKNLICVELYVCKLTGDTIIALLNLIQLQTLVIGHSMGFSGKYLSGFKNLKFLSLEDCSTIQHNYFRQMCKFISLVSLNIRGCYRLNEKSFKDLATHCKQLKYLDMSARYNTENLYHVAHIEKLESLEIHCRWMTLQDRLFTELALFKANQLKRLIINGDSILNSNVKKNAICQLSELEYFRCPSDTNIDDNFLIDLSELPELKELHIYGCKNINESGILKFIRKSNRLMKLDVSCCPQLTENLILNIIDILKYKGRPKPLECILVYSEIDNNIINHQKFLENKSLLQIEFFDNKANNYYDIIYGMMY